MLMEDIWETLRHPPATPLTPIPDPICADLGVRLWVKRDDLLQMGNDEGFLGNKWRKLQYNLLAAREAGEQVLLTFGGAYSNHLAAVAAAGKLFDFRTVGIVRGHPPREGNVTLRYAAACGMDLRYVDRATYRRKNEIVFLEELRAQYGSCYVIPEGGSNALALEGCRALGEELAGQCPERPLYVATACGTGGTLAGVATGLPPGALALGFPVLKGGFMTEAVAGFIAQAPAPVEAGWRMINDYHFGGFAKFNPELIRFINEFKRQYEIRLDPVYTGKMIWGVLDLIRRGYFPEGSNIVAIHTGGLQGIRGFNERFGSLIL